MKKTLWYMYKPGDTRDYALVSPPSPEWAEAMRKEGFKLFECLVDIPQDELTTHLEGFGDEAAPAREVALGAECRSCGAAGDEEHTSDCFHL